MYKARVINKDTGEPIIGAVVRGQKGIEAVTDEDGFFSLNTNDDQTLHISYIGFKEQDIKAQTLKGQPTIGLIPWYRPSGGTGHCQYFQCSQSESTGQ